MPCLERRLANDWLNNRNAFVLDAVSGVKAMRSLRCGSSQYVFRIRNRAELIDFQRRFLFIFGFEFFHTIAIVRQTASIPKKLHCKTGEFPGSDFEEQTQTCLATNRPIDESPSANGQPFPSHFNIPISTTIAPNRRRNDVFVDTKRYYNILI